MVLSRLMVHAQQVEDIRLRKKNREAKKAGSLERSSSKSNLDVHDKPKFKRSFSNQVPSNFTKNLNDRGSNPKPQKGRNVDPLKETPTCGKCGKKNMRECLVGTNSFYGCGKGCHTVKDLTIVRIQCKENNQAQSSGFNSEDKKWNRFYALKARLNKRTLLT